MAQRYPVLDQFTVTTPSLSVVIRADDTPLPADVQPQKGPASLVTVHAAEVPERFRQQQPEEAAPPVRSGSLTQAQMVQGLHAQQQHLQLQVLQQHTLLQQQQRLNHPITSEQLMQLQQLQQQHEVAAAQLQQAVNEQVELDGILKRSESKHADAVYSKLGAPPPIQAFDYEVAEEDSEGFIKRISTYETKDFTYWDKRKRLNTETVIRRWHTYLPEDEEDTAFYGRNIQAEMPHEAYTQGTYYASLDPTLKPKEYKLPTEQYVAPPVYIHRRGFIEPRMHDPLRQMVRNMNACCCAE